MNPDHPFGVKNVTDARELLEITKREWSTAVGVAIRDQLRATGHYCSNDLDHLDIPEEIRSSVFGAQTAGAVTAGLMTRDGYTRATRPESHGREVKTFVITPKGRDKLAAGVDAGSCGGSPSVDPGGRTIAQPAEAGSPTDDPRHLQLEPGPNSPPGPGPGSTPSPDRPGQTAGRPESAAPDGQAPAADSPDPGEQLELIPGLDTGSGYTDIDQRKAA